MITDGKPIENVYQYMKDVKQMVTLTDAMKELVLQGVSTTEEMIRITFNI